MTVANEEQVLNPIRRRRSMPRVHSQRPPREAIEQLLSAAVTAPNHHKTEPWRFVVLAGDMRVRLGDVMAASLAGRLPPADPDELEPALAKERAKPLRAPVIIAVAAEPAEGPKIVEIEEIEATAAAVQNILLAAEALGLGAMWRTGKPAYDPAVKEFLGLSPHAHIVAFVYVGYPDLDELPPRARGAQAHTRWLGWD